MCAAAAPVNLALAIGLEVPGISVKGSGSGEICSSCNRICEFEQVLEVVGVSICIYFNATVRSTRSISLSRRMCTRNVGQ
eukprot:5847326-Pyramimonas_sp.AAC.1